MLTHLSIAHSVLHYEACMRLVAGDRSALAVPASHVTGLIAIIAAMWHVGGTVVVVPEFKAEPFVQLLARERVSHTLLVPAMYRLCLMSESFAARRPVELAGRRLRRRADAGRDDRRARREAAAADAAQRLRLDRDHLAGDADAARPGRRPRRLGRRAAALRRHPGDGRLRPRAASRRDRRALDRRADGGARLLGQPRGDRGLVHRRLLALRRPRLEGRRRATCASSTASRTCSIAAATRSTRSRSRTR